MKNGKVYLVPCLLGDTGLEQLNPILFKLLPKIHFYAVENLRSARRFLKKVDRTIDIDQCTFFEMQKEIVIQEQLDFLTHASAGNDVAIISEAGMPAIADPGEEMVALAHELRLEVVPLIGANSMMLALAASGLNGEQFTFHGYLPIDKKERAKALKQIESDSLRSGYTQIFMETPYRNNQMLETILQNCKGDSRLCIAANLTLESEKILSFTIATWKKHKVDLHKQPAVFLLQAR